MRFLRFAARCAFELLFALAVLACVLVLALHWLPTTDWAKARLREELARALVPLGVEIEFDGFTVHWFQPRVELTGVRIGPRGRDGEIELARAHLAWNFGAHAAADGARIDLVGLELVRGRLRISQPWLESFDTSGLRPADAAASDWAKRVPPVLVHDLDVVLATNAEREVQLGRVEAFLTARGRDLALAGELRSSIGLQSEATVHLEGSGRPGEGFELKAWGSDLRVSRERIADLLGAAALPSSDFGGECDLVCGARLHGAADKPAEAWLELRLRDAAVQLDAQRRIDEAQLALSLACRADALEGLWRVDAWNGVAVGNARWNGSAFATRARLGKSAGAGYALCGDLSVPELHLERDVLEALGLWSYASRDWEALDPHGRCRMSAAFRVPALGGANDVATSLREAEIAIDFAHEGASGITFHGWLEHDGKRRGFPLEATQARGRTLFVLEPKSARPFRFGLLDLEARAADGAESRVVRCHGLLGSPRSGKRPELDLELDIPEISLGAELEHALGGMPETAWIWNEFQPSGGSVRAHWRLVQNEALQGLAAAGDMRIANANATWSELGVPLQGLAGDLSVRFAGHATEVRAGEKLLGLQRPVGVSFALSGKLQTAEAVRIAGVVRGDTLPRVVAPLDKPAHEIQWVEVAIQKLAWTGKDVQQLARWESEIERRISEFKPRGHADAHWAGGRVAPDAPYRWDLEIDLRNARVQPEVIEAQLQDVDGRVLIGSTREANARAADAHDELAIGVAVRGSWTGAAVAVAAHADAGAPLDLEFHAAGVDPANAAVLGSLALLRSNGAPGERNVERGSLAFAGRLDLHGRLRFELDSAERASPAITAWPRGMALRWGSFALEDVHGLVRLEDNVLRAEELRARMSTTPVVLQRVRLLPEAALEHLPLERDRLGDVRVPSGSTVFLADLASLSVPLDREHLGAFVDPAGLERLDRFALGGVLDVAGLRLLVFGDAGSGGSVHASGHIAVRDFRAAVGIPIEIDEGRLDLESLVIERGRVRGWAHFSNGKGAIAGRTFDAASLVASFVDGRLNIDDLASGFQGGRLSSLGGERGNAFALDLGEPYHFSLALELAKVELQGLLKGVFDAGIADSGICDARVRLSGRFADLMGMQGSGTIELLKTRLWSIPVVRSLFSQIGLDSSATFQEMRTRFELRNGEIRMHPIVVTSPLLSLEGSGRLGLDGRLRHDFELRYNLVDRLGPFTRLLYWVQNNLLRVAVRGDITRPIVILRSTLLDLFRERDSLQRHLPLPAFSGIPRRF